MIFYFLKFTFNFFLNICSFILKFIIRKEDNIILIGGWMGETFSDNSRFLYQYLHYYSDKKVIWVTRNNKIVKELTEKGYHVYKMHSLKSYYYHFKSGVHIVCNVPFKAKNYKGDILGELSLFSRRIQLWHGIPLKGIGSISDTDTQFGKVSPIRKISIFLKSNKIYRHLINVGGGWDNYTLVATSDLVANIFSKAFGDDKKICVSSYPRNCECIEYLSDEIRILEKIKRRRTILYVPTFREKNRKILHPLMDVNFRKFIRDENYLWIEKRHLADSNNIKLEFTDVEEILLSSSFDLNVIVPKIDILITDYSSICFDFIFFNKPVQYFVPDFDFYKSEERGFSLSFDDFTAGYISKNTIELTNNIKLQNFSKQMEKVLIVKDKVYQNSIAKYSDIVNELDL